MNELSSGNKKRKTNKYTAVHAKVEVLDGADYLDYVEDNTTSNE